jgi:hypothetical protein
MTSPANTPAAGDLEGVHAGPLRARTVVVRRSLTAAAQALIIKELHHR